MLEVNKTRQIAQDIVNVRKTSSRSLEPISEHSCFITATLRSLIIDVCKR